MKYEEGGSLRVSSAIRGEGTGRRVTLLELMIEVSLF